MTQILIGNAAEWNAEQKALSFGSKVRASDIATGLCWNGYPAMVVEVPAYMENVLINKD